jgi:chloramphenicol O-acetyltransferase type A
MPRPLDLATWKRRQHFDFFRRFDQPFFNVCAEVDATALARAAAAPEGPRFSTALFYLSLGAANEIEELRYRLCGESVVVHEVVHGGSTVLLPDETFSFAYFDFIPDFPRFAAQVAESFEAVRSAPLHLEPRDDRDDLIHYSVIPWVSFTSFAHARTARGNDSVPKIVFGRRHEKDGRWRMPVSVEVHHALVDGLHVGRFFERFQARLDDLPGL